MKRKFFFRSTLAWALLLCMLVGLMPVNVFATEGEEEAKAATKAATNYVSQINSLPTPYNIAYDDTVWNYSNIATGVHYYVVNKASDTQGHLLAMNQKFTNRYYHATDVAINGTSLTDPNPDSAVKFVLGDSASRAAIHPIKGVTTAVAGLVDETYVSIFRSTPSGFGGRSTEGKRIFLSYMGDISYAKDSWFSLQYVPTRVADDEFYGDDGFSVIFHEGHEEKYIDAELMQLYRVYTQGFELYKAIKAMVGYADGNADGRYPEELYTEFSNHLASCISTYNTNNKAVSTTEEANLKETMDDMATTLLDYRDDLTKNDSSWKFIDIPVEVLDFRADGMVFEWSGSDTGYYSLWSAPGKTEYPNLTPSQRIRTGLTEEYLVDGQIVYKESTVKTVAQGLEKKIGYDWGTDGRIPGWNGVFYAKMNDLTEMGTFAETIGKTDTKANGGYLKWSEVKTCYDMAYYMLSNFWRAVKDDDNIDTVNQLGYNKVIPERKRLRLYQDKETGHYTMDASNIMCYNGYYTFNAMPLSPTTRLAQDAFFTPADHLGFETEAYKELLGDTDMGGELAKHQHELAETNYHFSLHAKGSFVYFRDQNLYFEFIGDDDVYFFINGRRVMDLGGDHPPAGQSLELNTIADEHGWVDGGVYSFDMFYIERHTARSNLRFSTNIKIVETETMTTKGMYLENSDGISKINSTTGMGEELSENALLRDGDVVAYSFDIANSRNAPVYNLSFDDASMGASLSPNAITLCNTSLTGGVNTDISNIKVYYRTIDKNGIISSANPITKTYEEIESMINTANSKKTSLDAGVYCVSPGSLAILKKMLTLGIPAKCQIVIYGFRRLAQASLPNYQNTVYSVCYYNLSGTGQTTVGAEEIPVNGSATRTYKVTAEPPTSQKLELVLDYGKAVKIPTTTVGTNIQTDALTTVTGFAGLVTSGNHEQVLSYISSSNLKCASEGQTYAGKQGTFIRTAEGLDYQPTRFMDTIETVYLVFNIVATNSNHKYMLVELKLLPATFVYYETDFAQNIFKISDEQAWKTVEDSTTAVDRYQDQEFINLSTGEMTTSKLETMGAGPAILNEHYGIRNGLSNYNNNIPLSFSHRGSFRTSSENSYLAILESLKQGMDGVEIDLMITSDKVVVLSHDTTLSRTTGDNVTIANVTWNSIRDYPLEVGNGTGAGQDYVLTADEATLLNSTISKYAEHYGEAATSGGKHYTARLDDVLELIKKKAPNAILTFDKVNDNKDVFVYSYKAAYEAGMLKNVFFKLGKDAATLKTWASAAATACGITQADVLSSMQMLWVIGVPTASTVNSLRSYRNSGINVVALEGSWETALTAEQESVIINTVMPYCRENNIDFWPTVIGPRWAGQWDDDETTWAYYLEELGVDGLMTDRPEEFGAFMHYYNGASRSTSELIQAEHFQSYNIGSAKFYMNEAADINNNKLVNEMHNGDHLEYRNITFTGSENTLYITAKGLNGGGTLKFYVDSMKEENCFARVSFGSSEYCVTRSVTMLKTVSKGTHKVYVKAWGNKGVALLSFDSYTFQKQSDDHFLFFDFNNTTEDQTRYKKAIYGSNHNFDIRDYWATYASDNSNDRVNKTNFSIDNEKGIAKVTVGDDFEGEKNYCGPKFMTTKTYGVFPYGGQGANAPLKYVPSPNDYLVVRFKLENVIAGSDYAPMLFMEYHWNDAAGTDKIKYEDLKADYSLTLDQWQTVAVPVSDTFKNATEITSLGLRFTGILSPGATDKGSVIIDYIYVGPIQQGDHLLIDFEEKQGSYEDPVYGGMNYDSEARWTYRSGRTEAHVINDGTISITTKGNSDASYYHILMKDAALNYTPGDDDYCEVRFKISDGAVENTSNNTTVNFYFSPDLYGTAGCGDKNNSSAKFDLNAINNGDYYTLQIPMTSVYYRDAGIIRSITLMFNNLAKNMVGTITVDYIYLGPLDQAPSSNSEPLFFDFTDTVADRERYNSHTYGYYNFDQSGEGHWATYATAQGEATNMTNYVIDNNAGTATITVGDTAEGENVYGPKFQTTKTYGVYPWNSEDAHKQAPLHYKPTGKEYIQARFKIEGCENVGNVKFQLDYHYEPTSSAFMKYGGLDKPFTYTDGEWLTVTHSLAGISSFQNADEILSVGLRFTGIKSKDANNLGRVVIDYIYIGPEETLPTNNFVTYGYDSSYTDDSRLSNGSSLFVEGAGIPYIAKDSNGNPTYIDYAAADSYTETSFTFTGTGFDIISRTNVNQGLVRAVILDSKGAIVKNVSVINKGKSELYQIPVLSVEGLTHGKYTVKLFVDEKFDYGNDGNADIFGGGMDRGGEFYFDAVRIYNPINTRATDTNSRYAYEVYQKHGEADPTITEVRDILIDANNFTAGSAANGVVYLDATAKEGTEFDNEDGKLEPKIAEYRAIGPNNEVYLTPGNAIAFKLEVEGPIPASIDIGAKSADGAEASMIVGVSKTVPTTLPAGTDRKIQTATAQYYPMEILPSRWNTATANNTDTHWVYVTIYNYGATGILSVTDIKYAYDFPNPEEPASRKMVRFVVDQQMLDIYANPCNHTWDQGEITTAPTCTAQGVKTYTCTACGSSYTETVPALGHSYINGVCSCGQAEAKEPIQETSWKLNHSLNLASDISVNLVVPKTLLEGFDMATVYVESTLEIYEGNIKTGTKTIRVEPVDNGYFYYFTLDGLTAVQMNDKISSVLYGTKNGQTYYSPVDEYSIATYAYAQLNKTGIVESLKTLCADLLRYGAKAQIFKSYRTDSLADANMTDAHKAFLSDMDAVTFGNTNKVLNDLENAPISWAGKSLNLDSKVALKFVFDPVNYQGDPSMLTLKVSYTDISGERKTLSIGNPELYSPDMGLYVFTLDALLAAELRSVVSVQIFAGNIPVSCTLQYSADTYGNNKNGTLLELCKALFAYSDSAKNYFQP